MLWIESETDGSGSAQANRRIAEARAQWVVDELLARGVDPDRLAVIAIRPRVVTHQDSGRRRVMISTTRHE
jgi:outer membrane protein OmpA-like peptidoglycan-associated protein